MMGRTILLASLASVASLVAAIEVLGAERDIQYSVTSSIGHEAAEMGSASTMDTVRAILQTCIGQMCPSSTSTPNGGGSFALLTSTTSTNGDGSKPSISSASDGTATSSVSYLSTSSASATSTASSTSTTASSTSTSSSTSSSSPSSSSSSNTLSTGATVGIAIGAVALVAILVGLLFLCRRRRRRSLMKPHTGAPKFQPMALTAASRRNSPSTSRDGGRDLAAEKIGMVRVSHERAGPNDSIGGTGGTGGGGGNDMARMASRGTDRVSNDNDGGGGGNRDSEEIARDWAERNPSRSESYTDAPGGHARGGGAGGYSSVPEPLREPGMSAEELARLEDEERRIDEAIAASERH